MFFLTLCFLQLSCTSRSKRAGTGASQSRGKHFGGSLVNASYLENDGFGFVKILRNRKRNYGNAVMVSFVEDVAKWNKSKDSKTERLQIGDLSRKHGGKTLQHKSHQNGLDVDIVYLRKSRREEGLYGTYWESHFVKRKKLDPDFDLPRNAALLLRVLEDPRVYRVFVDTVIRDAVLKYFKTASLDAKQRKNFSKLIAQNLHKTHFHVRLYCPKKDRTCVGQRAS